MIIIAFIKFEQPKKLVEKGIRKLQKNRWNENCYHITIPYKIVKEIKWNRGDYITFKIVRDKIVMEKVIWENAKEKERLE